MRPLIVLTGQGMARADGFNLTRRMKALPLFAELTAAVARKDRQNLDVLLEACGAAGADALDRIVRELRTICLKERRSTQRKAAHQGVFAALAKVAASRLVLHLTANIDGLTTTFAVRDFRAVWPPFRGICSETQLVAAAQEVLDAGRGMLHFPVHGEAGLVVSSEGGRLQTFYGEPRLLRGEATWVPTVRLGIAFGVRDIERRLAPARLGYALLDALLEGAASRDLALRVEGLPHADLLVIGYGAEDRGARGAHPFEHRIAEHVAAGMRDPAARWTALVYRPQENHRAAHWFADHGFIVLPYDDGELPQATRQALTRPLPGARCLAVDRELDGCAQDSPPRGC